LEDLLDPADKTPYSEVVYLVREFRIELVELSLVLDELLSTHVWLVDVLLDKHLTDLQKQLSVQSI